MKKINIVQWIFICLISSTAYANDVCVEKHGTLTCVDGVVDNVSYMGFVDLDGTTVLNRFDVLGDASIHRATLKKVHIKGEARIAKSNVIGQFDLTGNVTMNDVGINGITDVIGDMVANHVVFNEKAKVIGKINCLFCRFKTDTSVVGDFIVDSSVFDGSLTLNVLKGTFINTTAGDIVIKYDEKQKEQLIELKNKTIVHTIFFEGQRGTVVLSGDSKITGLVQGGKIVNN